MSRSGRSCSIVLVAALAAPATAGGSTFNVNSTLDLRDKTPLGDGVVDVDLAQAGDQITLRAAIEEANHLAGFETINLPAGTFNLTRDGAKENQCARGDLDVNDGIQIWGAGAGLTFIDAHLISDRAFHIREGVYPCIIGDLTVRRGSTGSSKQHGGGILVSDAALDLRRVEMSENVSEGKGGALAVLGSSELDLYEVWFDGNRSGDDGGALYFKGPGGLTANDCYFSDNHAEGNGGGIWLGMGGGGGSGQHVRGCTFSMNEAEGGGGAVHVSGALYVDNSTFSKNAALRGGAFALWGGGLYVENSTLTKNKANQGSGFFEDPNNPASWIYVGNSIVANTKSTNYSGDGLESLGANIDSGSTCGFDAPGDMEHTNPKLGILKDNGGPTPTIALLATSPALDAGDDSMAGPWDQRYLRRVDLPGVGVPGYSSDIGAFERQVP